MSEGSKHIISYIIFVIFSIVFVIDTNDNVAIDNVVFAVSVASLFISLSDLFDVMMRIDKEELQVIIDFVDLYKKEKNGTYDKAGKNDKELLKELEKLVYRLEEEESEVDRAINDAMKKAQKKWQIKKSLSTLFYIGGFALLPIIILMRNNLIEVVRNADSIVTLSAFLVVQFVIFIKASYKEKSEKAIKKSIESWGEYKKI